MDSNLDSEDFHHLEDEEDEEDNEAFDEGGVLLADPICTGLSRSACRHHRHHCQYTNPRGGLARCERIEPCNGKNRDQCNLVSPDCRWYSGDFSILRRASP